MSSFIGRAETLYDFHGQSPDDLSFSSGDIIQLTSTTGNWWSGTAWDGQSGCFPSNYVRLLQDDAVGQSPSLSSPPPPSSSGTPGVTPDSSGTMSLAELALSPPTYDVPVPHSMPPPLPPSALVAGENRGFVGGNQGTASSASKASSPSSPTSPVIVSPTKSRRETATRERGDGARRSSAKRGGDPSNAGGNGTRERSHTTSTRSSKIRREKSRRSHRSPRDGKGDGRGGGVRPGSTRPSLPVRDHTIRKSAAAANGRGAIIDAPPNDASDDEMRHSKSLEEQWKELRIMQDAFRVEAAQARAQIARERAELDKRVHTFRTQVTDEASARASRMKVLSSTLFSSLDAEQKGVLKQLIESLWYMERDLRRRELSLKEYEVRIRGLCSVDRLDQLNAIPHAQVVVMQRAAKSWMRRRAFRTAVSQHAKSDTKDAILLRRRAKSLKEIVHTEQVYQDGLGKLIEVYMRPASTMIHQKAVDVIFMNVETLRALSTNFLDQLVARFDAWPGEQRFSDLFIQLAPQLKLYNPFIAGFDRSSEALVKGKAQDKKFAQFIEAANATAGLTIESFLIMPIQRLPRYRILLEALISNTPETHVDYKGLLQAHENIIDAVAAVNAYKRQRELQKRAKELEQKNGTCIGGRPRNPTGIRGSTGSRSKPATPSSESPTARILVRAIRGQHMPAMDSGGTSDPFLTIQSSTRGSEKVKTTVVKKTLDPVWDDEFVLHLDIKGHVIVNCYDWNRGTPSLSKTEKDDFIGTAMITCMDILENYDNAGEQIFQLKDTYSSNLSPRRRKSMEQNGHLGEIVLEFNVVSRPMQTTSGPISTSLHGSIAPMLADTKSNSVSESNLRKSVGHSSKKKGKGTRHKTSKGRKGSKRGSKKKGKSDSSFGRTRSKSTRVAGRSSRPRPSASLLPD